VPGLVEGYAQLKGMALGRFTVIVEGTTDVAVLAHARRLYNEAKVIDLYADGFAVVAAGMGDDGGVDGVDRGLHVDPAVAAGGSGDRRDQVGLVVGPDVQHLG